MVRKFRPTPIVSIIIVVDIFLILLMILSGVICIVCLALLLCFVVWGTFVIFLEKERGLVLTDEHYEMTRKPALISLMFLFMLFGTGGTLHYLSQGNPLGTLLFLSMVVTGIALPLINGRCVLILTEEDYKRVRETKVPFLALAYIVVGVGGALYEISQGNFLGAFLFLLMAAVAASLFFPLIERRILILAEIR